MKQEEKEEKDRPKEEGKQTPSRQPTRCTTITDLTDAQVEQILRIEGVDDEQEDELVSDLTIKEFMASNLDSIAGKERAVVYPVTWEAPIASTPLVTTVTTVSTPVVPSQVTVQVKNVWHEAQ
jgi:hypothetical protein